MIDIPETELQWSAIRAQGSGGQNVNKVASALHLRFDIRASSLPDEVKTRLLLLRDARITADGVIVIKAQRYRSQEKNRADALVRLSEIIEAGMVEEKPRKPTRTPRSVKRRRLDNKTRRGQVKALRGKVFE